MSKLRLHLNYANVMVTILAFVVLGGTAWALAKNSVGSRQIKPKAVKTSDIANNAVKSIKVADGSLLSQDFAVGQLPAGPQGERGIQGLPGADGAQGTPGSDGAQGPPGPTAAVAKGSSGGPVADPDLLTDLSTTIAAPASGRVLAMFTTSGAHLSVDCTAGDPRLGLYVDAIPVPETLRVLTDAVGEPIDVFGVTAAPVQAGNHEIQIGVNCPDGDVVLPSPSLSVGETSIGGLLIGS